MDNPNFNVVSLIFHIVPIVVALIILLVLLRNTFVYINNGYYGVVEKKWAFHGRKRTSFIALHGEPGFQPELIMGGFHLFFPGMYKIHKQKMITIKGIGYLFARDGEPMTEGQALAKFPENTLITDARAFIVNGGQQGPQRYILRQGLHAINTALFAVFTEEGTFTITVGENAILETINASITEVEGYNPIVLDSDEIGIVTVNDGPSLEHGEIVAPTVGTDSKDKDLFHNSFQSIEKFFKAGGRRGRQEQVLVEGTYYINCLFADVETAAKEIIPIGNVGVVNSYSGATGISIADADFQHGEIVENGQKGIWKNPLTPGKYAINHYAMNIIQIPTTNLVLNWYKNKSEDHGYDHQLTEIKLITHDGYEPIIGVALVIHIRREDAPYVVQQFGDITRLVEQTLDSIVTSWFKDAVQDKSIIELIQTRSELQTQAFAEISAKFLKYRISVQSIVLGTPRSDIGDLSIDVIYQQLQQRQLAKEQATTFAAKQETAKTEKTYNEAAATASNQASLTASSIAIQIAENNGSAELARKRKEAEALVVTAEAEAKRITVEGQANADRITAIGTAEASAARAQVDAYGGADVAARKAIAEILGDAMKHSSFPMVPNILSSGDNNGGGVPSLLASMVMNNLGDKNDNTKNDAAPKGRR